MKLSLFRIGIVVELILFSGLPLSGQETAVPQVDGGTADIKAWSGSWWPHQQGGLQLPLGKYDIATHSTASEWEKKNHPAEASTPQWHGFCHAWAASSVLEREPNAELDVNNDGITTHLTVGDQKGWLAACHTMDIANVYGDRFGDKEGSEDRSDIAPDVLWRLLQFYIRERGVPLILDIEAGAEVWNYPVYAYEVIYVPVEATQFRGTLALEMADNFVAPSFVGIKPKKATYEFEFEMNEGAIVAGSARWVGSSVSNHPDFAWYPYVAVAENPEVNVDLIQSMLAEQAEIPLPDISDTSSTNAVEAVAAVPVTDAPAVPAHESETPAEPSSTETVSVNSQQEAVLLSPGEMLALVTNETSKFLVDLQLPDIEGQRVKAGQSFTVRVLSEKSGYLHVFMIDSQGAISLLFPRSPIDDNQMAENGEKVIEVGADSQPLAAAGTRIIKAVVTQKPLLLSDLADASEAYGVPDPTQQASSAVPSQSTFRFNPSLALQVQSILTEYQQNGATSEVVNAHSRVIADWGPFGQDRAMFHINANESR